MTQKFTDATTLSGTRMTSDGYLVADVLCARTGCQDYLGAEMGVEADVVTVYRPESAVFNKDSMATFSGKPVTLGHPPEPVNADNWKDYAAGDIGEDIARDGEAIRVPIKLMDAAAIYAVMNGTREISMGYTTPIRMEDGVAPDGTPYQAIQTGPIKINHLAIVDRARGGSKLRIGDSAGKWGAAPTQPSSGKEVTMTDKLTTVVLGDKAAQVAPTDAAIIEAFKADQAKKLTDMETAHAAAITAKDEEIGTLKADKKKLEDAALTPDKITALVADRVSLETTVKTISDKINLAGVSDADLRKAAVAFKLGDEMVADASDAEISGMFKAIAKDVKPADTVADAIADAKATGGVVVDYDARDQRIRNAHKKKEA